MKKQILFQELNSIFKEFLNPYNYEKITDFYAGHIAAQSTVLFCSNRLMTDMENLMPNNSKLVREHWTNVFKRREFFKKYNSYFEAWHGDYIYTNMYQLHK